MVCSQNKMRHISNVHFYSTFKHTGMHHVQLVQHTLPESRPVQNNILHYLVNLHTKTHKLYKNDTKCKML